MRRIINLELPAPIVTEILNDLYDGLDVWRNTEEYLASGSVVAPCVVAESCDDSLFFLMYHHLL